MHPWIPKNPAGGTMTTTFLIAFDREEESRSRV